MAFFNFISVIIFKVDVNIINFNNELECEVQGQSNTNEDNIDGISIIPGTPEQILFGGEQGSINDDTSDKKKKKN